MLLDTKLKVQITTVLTFLKSKNQIIKFKNLLDTLSNCSRNCLIRGEAFKVWV